MTVSAGTAPGTTADYNAFYVNGDNATAPHGWAGSVHGTLDAFRAGVPGQGTHDLVDPKKPNPAEIRAFSIAKVDFRLQQGSASIGSANPAAPGRPGSDFFGRTPFDSRGATQSDNPDLSVTLSATQTSGRGIDLTSAVRSAGPNGRLSVNWGDSSGGASYPVTDGTLTKSPSYAKIGTYDVTVTLTDGRGNAVSNTVKVTTAGSEYTPYGPTRLLDTRSGLGAPKQKVGPFGTVRLKVGGNGGIPADATAVVLNLTVTSPTAPGFITAYPHGGARPTTSNVNYTAGRTVQNLAVVPVRTDGYVDLYSGSNGSVDLIADVTGYFTRSAANGYTSVPPTRLAGTRSGFGTAPGKLGGGRSFQLQIGGVPVDGQDTPIPWKVSAVALNVTATGGTGNGFLTLYPTRQNSLVASNLNYSAGQTIANAVIVPVGPDGEINVLNGIVGTETDMVVDVVGYYSTTGTGAYVPVPPERLADTRNRQDGAVRPGEYAYMPLSPDEPGITAYVLNTTVTRTTGGGYLTVSPDPNTVGAYQGGRAARPDRPLVSTLNWHKGQTVPNLVQAGSGDNGIVDFWNTGNGTTDLVVDISGYYDRL